MQVSVTGIQTLDTLHMHVQRQRFIGIVSLKEVIQSVL